MAYTSNKFYVYPQKMVWHNLSKNENAIHILAQNLDKVRWYDL